MTIESTFDFFQRLRNDHLSLIYQGYFSDDITGKVIDLSEQNIDTLAQGKIKRRVSFLLAECFQNIVRHGENPGTINRATDKTGVFLTRHIGNTFYITSANLIETDAVAGLKEKLEKVNELDPDGLKTLSREVLSNEEMSDKGGAGLGLIEMARKSGQKLEYAFENVNDKLLYFYLQVKFRPKGAEEPAPIEEAALSVAVDCHRQMEDNNILLIHKGDYTQKSILPVLKMIESNIQAQFETFSVRKKVYHLMVELLQNIANHGSKLNDRREGIFMMGKTRMHYVLTAGNLVKEEQVPALRSLLEELQGLDKDGLKNLFREMLKKRKDQVNPNEGMGLIDMAREASGPIEFVLEPFQEGLYFYCLKLVI